MDREMGADALLVRRLIEGYEDSWVTVFRKFQDVVYRFAFHMTGSREVAEEAVQETFIAFLDRASHFDPALGSLQSYLIGIARNRVLKMLARGRRETPGEGRPEPVSGSDVFSELAGRQRQESLRRTILALPEPYRAAVVLCELEEMSYDEAAAALECPVGTVRSRLHRGRQMLMERMVGKGCPV